MRRFLVHDDEPVGIDEGVEAVRDDESGSIARQTVEFLRDRVV
jgi:hypothetical protein